MSWAEVKYITDSVKTELINAGSTQLYLEGSGSYGTQQSVSYPNTRSWALINKRPMDISPGGNALYSAFVAVADSYGSISYSRNSPTSFASMPAGATLYGYITSSSLLGNPSPSAASPMGLTKTHYIYVYYTSLCLWEIAKAPSSGNYICSKVTISSTLSSGNFLKYALDSDGTYCYGICDKGIIRYDSSGATLLSRTLPFDIANGGCSDVYGGKLYIWSADKLHIFDLTSFTWETHDVELSLVNGYSDIYVSNDSYITMLNQRSVASGKMYRYNPVTKEGSFYPYPLPYAGYNPAFLTSSNTYVAPYSKLYISATASMPTKTVFATVGQKIITNTESASVSGAKQEGKVFTMTSDGPHTFSADVLANVNNRYAILKG